MKPILLCAVFALALTVAPLDANAEVVNIGISTVGLYELPTEISKRKGFYQEEGLEVRKVVVRTPLHVAALLAGELDYSTVTGIILSASVQGMPLKTVMGWFDKPLHMLIARPNIKRLTDLKDKRVAVSTYGSIPHVMIREALASAGMNPEKDITVLALGGSGDRLGGAGGWYCRCDPAGCGVHSENRKARLYQSSLSRRRGKPPPRRLRRRYR